MRKVFSLATASFLAFSAAPAMAETVFNVSSWVPPSQLLAAEVLHPWTDKVTQATEGRVKFNFLPKAVAAPPASFDAVRDGLADLSFTVHGYTPGRFLLSTVVEFPFLGDSATSISVAYQRIYEKMLAEKGEHKGVVPLAVFSHGPGYIFNKTRAVTKVADLDGLKIRVGGGVVNEVTKVLGVTSILKPSSQSFELMNAGVVDGVFFPSESVTAFKLEGLTKYGTIVPGGLYNTSFLIMMNPESLAKLSEADQKVLLGLAGEPLARLAGERWDAADAKALEVLKAAGVELVTADAAFLADVAARTKPIEEGWYAKTKDIGVDGAAVMEALRAEIRKAATGG